jgi:hypothetical protein
MVSRIFHPAKPCLIFAFTCINSAIAGGKIAFKENAQGAGTKRRHQ